MPGKFSGLKNTTTTTESSVEESSESNIDSNPNQTRGIKSFDTEQNDDN